MKLRYLAESSVWDSQSNFEVSVEKFYQIIRKAIEDIKDLFNVNLELNDMESFYNTEVGFDAKSRPNVLRCAVEALHGCLLWEKNSRR